MTLLLILMPMICIVLQRETGSALVYLAFFLMFYREGMPGSILFTGVAMVIYFVVGIRFADVHFGETPTSVGKFSVILLIQLFSIGMVWVYCNRRLAWKLLLYCIGATLVSLIFLKLSFDITYIQLGLTALLVGYLLWEGLGTRIRSYFFIALFALGSLGFFYGADFIMQNVMEPHQTKLKFVPEQDTDFIFCTVGEEEGFLGSAGVLVLFLALILRLIYLSERQPRPFGRIYGYCVLSIFLFHLFINVGMVLGLTPVIGIPLPFFSYGGSSLWGFTFLLFIFLRLDASRNLLRG